MILSRFQIIPLNIEFCVIATVKETKAMAYFMVINLVTKCSTIPKAQIGYSNDFTFGFQMRKVHTLIIKIIPIGFFHKPINIIFINLLGNIKTIDFKMLFISIKPIINIKIEVGPKGIPFHVVMFLSAHVIFPPDS